MKLSEIDVPFVKEYLRQDGDEDDKLIGAILEGAKDYWIVNSYSDNFFKGVYWFELHLELNSLMLNEYDGC